MKLVQIQHIRCQEYDSTEYAYVPDDWDEDTIKQKIYDAQEAYLAELERVRNEENCPKEPTWKPEYEKYPNKTVAEVQALHEAAKDAYKAYREDHKASRVSFTGWLRREGFVPFYDNEDYFEVEVNWGHRHGVSLIYGEGSPSISKIPSPEKFDETNENYFA